MIKTKTEIAGFTVRAWKNRDDALGCATLLTKYSGKLHITHRSDFCNGWLLKIDAGSYYDANGLLPGPVVAALARLELKMHPKVCDLRKALLVAAAAYGELTIDEVGGTVTVSCPDGVVWSFSTPSRRESASEKTVSMKEIVKEMAEEEPKLRIELEKQERKLQPPELSLSEEMRLELERTFHTAIRMVYGAATYQITAKEQADGSPGVLLQIWKAGTQMLRAPVLQVSGHDEPACQRKAIEHMQRINATVNYMVQGEQAEKSMAASPPEFIMVKPGFYKVTLLQGSLDVPLEYKFHRAIRSVYGERTWARLIEDQSKEVQFELQVWPGDVLPVDVAKHKPLLMATGRSEDECMEYMIEHLSNHPGDVPIDNNRKDRG